MMEGKNEFSIKRIEPTSYVFSKEKQLGKGAFGEVYLGFDEKSKKPVAIKTISYTRLSQVYSNEQVIGQKLAGELVSMQLCKGDRLVKLISPHHSSKNMYVVCEYCNGGSLKDYLNKKGQLSEFEALNFFKDILEGFRQLNDSRIVHRDMKPANLLLNNRRIKIGDLGFSKIISGHEEILTSAVGTPLYMSPQILSSSIYTEKTDIWSLGIILFEMLVGELPWRVNSIQEIKEKVKHRPEFPRNCMIDSATKLLILKMLAPEEKDRIGWQELFAMYIAPQDQRMEQELSALHSKVRQADQHFLSSLALESEHHIVFMLERNGVKFMDLFAGCQNSHQFFQRVKDVKQQQRLIESLVNIHIEGRNSNSFLMKLFVECFDNYNQLNSPVLLASMLMLLKYCIANTQLLLEKPQDETQKLEVYLNSSFYCNFKQLLLLDLKMMKSLLMVFQKDMFLPGLRELKPLNTSIVQSIERDLKPFVGEQSASIKFTEFWMKNQCRQLFNAFKDVEAIPDKWLLIPRMIYEYERSGKTHLFANLGEKSNMNKKLQVWAQEDRWRSKLKELKKFEIESIVSFLNREVTWNSLGIMGINFPSDKFQ